MAVKVHQVANVLHKGMDQVISDLQNMGVAVTKYYDVVQDSDLYHLAAQYGRKDYIFDLLSNEFFETVAASWNKEFLFEYLMQFQNRNGWLSQKDAERIAIIRKNFADSVELVKSEPIVCKTPRAFRGIYLVGTDEHALTQYSLKNDLHIFLIPKTQKEEKLCCISFSKKDSVHIKVNVESCMLLVWNYGRYFYVPVTFKKLGEVYYFDLHKFLEENNMMYLPEGYWTNMNKRGIGCMKKYVLPGNCGFAMQHENKCKIRLDQGRIQIAGRTVEEVWWNCMEPVMRITSKADIRKAVATLIMQEGEVSEDIFLEFMDALEGTLQKLVANYNYEYRRWGMLEYCIRVPRVHVKQNIEKDDKQSAKMQEACRRLDILVEKGLVHRVRENFAIHGEVWMSETDNGACTYQIEDASLLEKIEAFEKQYDALVYHGVYTYSYDFGEMMSLFYVSNDSTQWEREREELRKENPIVYVESMEFEECSEFGGIKYFILDGAVKRLR